MINQKKSRQVNDYVLLFSAGSAVGTLFLWAASYIFPEGDIVEGRRVFENIPKYLQYAFYLLSASSVFISGYLFSLRAKNARSLSGVFVLILNAEYAVSFLTTSIAEIFLIISIWFL